MFSTSARLAIVIFIVLICSCKTEQESKAEPPHFVAVTLGNCNIRARIKSVAKPSGVDTADVCSKYPCRARVEILEVFGCGPGVSVPLNADDVVEMKFAYTLHSTEVIPGMKVHLPGLKKGDVFTATVSQRLVMGGSGEFVVYDYEVK